MAKNFTAPGKVFDHTLLAAVIAGAVIAMDKTIGVAMGDGAIGDTIAVRVDGVFSVPKTATGAIAQGALVYWDATPGEMTADATAPNVYAGRAYVAAADGDTSMQVLLNV